MSDELRCSCGHVMSAHYGIHCCVGQCECTGFALAANAVTSRSIPTTGRIVHHVLKKSGEVRPAMITRIMDNGLVNLSVFVDVTDMLPGPILPVPLCEYDESDSPRPGTWHWPPQTGA